MLIRDVPMIALQQAIFKCLSEGQNRKVYGIVPENAVFPYISMGSLTAKPVTVKDIVIWRMTINIDIWALDDDKRSVNESLNDISTLLTFHGENFNIKNYQVIDSNIDMVEAFQTEKQGYHGTLTAVFDVQKIN